MKHANRRHANSAIGVRRPLLPQPHLPSYVSPDTLLAFADPAPAQACFQIPRHRPWHPMLRPLQRVSTDIAQPAGTRCWVRNGAARLLSPPTHQPRRRCALPPDLPHFKHVCTPTVLAPLAPAAPTASSAVLNYTLASPTACDAISISSNVCAPCASAPSLLEACVHRPDVRPHGTICSRSFSSAPSPLEARAQRHDTRPHGASFCV